MIFEKLNNGSHIKIFSPKSIYYNENFERTMLIDRLENMFKNDVIMNKNDGRLSENDITVADLTGVAVQDIMITNAVYNNLNQL